MSEFNVERHSPPVASVPQEYSEAPQPAPELDDRLVRAKEAQKDRQEQLQRAKADEQVFLQTGGQVSEGVQVLDRAKSIEVTLPDGRVIEMTHPGKVTELLAQRICASRKYEDDKLMSYVLTQVRAVLHVKSIDGENVTLATNEVQYLAVVGKLGDAGLDAVLQVYAECFPPVQRGELKLVKNY